MDQQSHQRAKKAIRYRAKAKDLRFEAAATAPGPHREDKLSFADCQFASNRDPSFASNNDPLWVNGWAYPRSA